MLVSPEKYNCALYCRLSNEDELVLDSCIGSGSTAIACINTNRRFIGFELDKHYYEVANKRIEKETNRANAV